MTPSEYQQLASLTEHTSTQYEDVRKRMDVLHRLMHHAIGLGTEVGEFQDTLKKYIFYNKPMSKLQLTEELGDILWYVAGACNTLRVSMEEVMEMNIKKLRTRYPNRFNSHDALNRDTGAEYTAMEEGKENRKDTPTIHDVP